VRFRERVIYPLYGPKNSFNRGRTERTVFMENVHEENYKGLNIKISYDTDPMSPEDDKDDEVFLVAYHRQFSVDRGQRELITIFKEEGLVKDGG
jgi:hypothetical protein